MPKRLTTSCLSAGNSMSGVDTFKTMVTNIFKVILQGRTLLKD